jgi:hypothetical protein
MKIIFLLLLLGLNIIQIPLCGDESLVMEVIPSANLVKNNGFSQLNTKKLPLNWYFDNCSKSPHFRTTVVNNPSGNYLAVNTAWNNFGYWLQNIPVKEGVYYFVSCDVQSDNPAVALWLMANVKKSSKKKSLGKVRYFISMATRHGKERKEMLKDFFDEKLIPSLSANQWYSICEEVIFPKDRGIDKCAFRFGIYAGYAGQGRFRNPVFREAKATLKVKVKGENFKELFIKGAHPEKVKLDSTKSTQEISFVLPRAKWVYQVVLTNTLGKKVIKEVTNE